MFYLSSKTGGFWPDLKTVHWFMEINQRKKTNLAVHWLGFKNPQTTSMCQSFCKAPAVLGICFRIRMILGLPNPHPDPLVTSTDPAPDPSIIKQK
jgi:hypothetical protein